VLDTDGVITRTAEVHRAAWKQLFDEFLADPASPVPDPADRRPFDDEDYLRHVDGRPRADGVANFLRSRGVDLPVGDRRDPPGAPTVWGLGNRKNATFLGELARHGVRIHESTVELVRALRDAGVRVAAVSASENQLAVLEAAGVVGLFDVRVDGVMARDLGLPGKPDPALFLEAARRIGTPPGSTGLVEDARAGVRAGRSGGFRPVIGVDRGGAPEELARAGADVVVPDLDRVRVHDDGVVVVDGGLVDDDHPDDDRPDGERTDGEQDGGGTT
jgi:alpha,alpha-trehalase